MQNYSCCKTHWSSFSVLFFEKRAAQFRSKFNFFFTLLLRNGTDNAISVQLHIMDLDLFEIAKVRDSIGSYLPFNKVGFYKYIF